MNSCLLSLASHPVTTWYSYCLFVIACTLYLLYSMQCVTFVLQGIILAGNKVFNTLELVIRDSLLWTLDPTDVRGAMVDGHLTLKPRSHLCNVVDVRLFRVFSVIAIWATKRVNWLEISKNIVQFQNDGFAASPWPPSQSTEKGGTIGHSWSASGTYYT